MRRDQDGFFLARASDGVSDPATAIRGLKTPADLTKTQFIAVAGFKHSLCADFGVCLSVRLLIQTYRPTCINRPLKVCDNHAEAHHLQPACSHSRHLH